MGEPDLLYEVRGNAAWLTLNREERRNAISPEAIELLFDSLDKAEADENVRVVCLTGAGEKVFCSGADLMAAMGGGDATGVMQRFADVLKRMTSFPKPIVARLNGDCLAGGTGFMLACDIVYAPNTARFGTPEVKVGMFPMMIGALIYRNTRRKKAMEMVYTARMYSAAEAEEMGLITRAVPKDKLDEEVQKTLDEIAERGPAAIRIGKAAFAEAEDMPLGDALDFLSKKLVEVIQTEDAMEGISAFLQKRKPEWKGR